MAGRANREGPQTTPTSPLLGLGSNDGLGARLCENAGSRGQRAIIESKYRSRRIFDARVVYCVNQSCVPKARRIVFTRPRATPANSRFVIVGRYALRAVIRATGAELADTPPSRR